MKLAGWAGITFAVSALACQGNFVGGDAEPDSSADARAEADLDLDRERDAGADAGSDAELDGASDGAADAEPDAEAGPEPDAETEPDADAALPEPVVPRAGSALLVDGALDDWPPLRFELRFATAAFVHGEPPVDEADCSVDFDLRWDEAFLYFGALVRDDLARSDSTRVWDDDSVELYLDGVPDLTRAFGPDDHQYTVTRDGRLAEIGTVFSPDSVGIELGVRTSPGGFTLELAVPWDQLGGAPAPGRPISITVGVNDDDDGGEGDTHAVMWVRSPGGTHPSADSTQFRDFTLGP